MTHLLLLILGSSAFGALLSVPSHPPSVLENPGAALVTPAPCASSRRGPGATTGRLLVTNQRSRTATIIDLETGAKTDVALPGAHPHGGAVSPDGRWGAVADYGKLVGSQLDGNRLFVIDMASGRVVRTIDTGDGYRALHDLEFVDAARVVVTAQRHQHVLEVDIARGRVRGAIPTKGVSSHTLALAGDGRTLFTSNEEEQFVSQLDLGSHTFVRPVAVGANPIGLAITPDGRELWVGTRGSVKIVDVARGAVVAEIPGVGFPDDLSISADGTRAAVPDSTGDAVLLVDVAQRKVITRFAIGRPTSVYLHSDNRTIFVTLRNQGAVAVLDGPGACEVARYQTGIHPDEVGWGPK